MRNPVPTGRRRHRSQHVKFGWRDWRTVLILQIEERGYVSRWSAGVTDGEFMNRWRDATIGDITVGEPMKEQIL